MTTESVAGSTRLRWFRGLHPSWAASLIGAPLLFVFVVWPFRLRIPGPFHSVSIFELVLPIAFITELFQSRARLKLVSRTVVVPAGMFLGWVLLSVLWAGNRILWLRAMIYLTEGLAIGVTLYLWGSRTGSKRAWTAWALLGTISALGALVWYFALGQPEWLNLSAPNTPAESLSQSLRLGSPSWGPSDYFASMLLLFLPIAVLDRLSGLLRLALLLSGALALAATFSRGAFVAVVLAPVPALLLSSRRYHVQLSRAQLATAGAIVVAFLAILARQVLSRPDVARGGVFYDPSRLSYYQIALQLYVHRPIFGYGYGSWPGLVSGTAIKGAHNYYVQIAVEGGLVGLALFISLFGALIATARRLDGRIALAATLALLAVGVNIALEASFEGAIFSWLFAMFVGLLLAEVRPSLTAAAS